MTTLKEQKEAFVTGHTGTTPLEICLVCCSAPIGIFLYLQLTSLLLPSSPSQQQQQQQQTSQRMTRMYLIIIELMVVLLPMTLCQTNWLYPYGVYMLGGEIALASCLFVLQRHRQRQQQQQQQQGNNNTHKKIQKETKLEYLTTYRSIISFLTYIAILAVDFHMFPRKFAKTEVYGYGLMDLGAASFVISGGFVSRYARNNTYTCNITNTSFSPPTSTTTMSLTVVINLLWTQMKKTLPLIIMGCIRLASTKGLEYQEHVSEYGVHWNFFFTLTVVTLLSSLWRGRKNTTTFMLNRGMMTAIIILILYQCLLSHYGLQEYIEDGSRYCQIKKQEGVEECFYHRIMNYLFWENKFWVYNCHFFAANREGVLGCVGYLCLYIMSEEIARVCCIWSSSQNNASSSASSTSTVEGERKNAKIENNHQQHQVGTRLFIASSLLWCTSILLETKFNIPASRRSTNVTFIFWALAQNVTVLFLTWLAFFLCAKKEDGEEDENSKEKKDARRVNALSSSSSPLIFAASNRYGLIIFIIANLLTGIVNLSINTLKVDDGLAILIVLMYLLCVGVVSLLLDWLCGGGSIASAVAKVTKGKKDKIQ